MEGEKWKRERNPERTARFSGCLPDFRQQLGAGRASRAEGGELLLSHFFCWALPRLVLLQPSPRADVSFQGSPGCARVSRRHLSVALQRRVLPLRRAQKMAPGPQPSPPSALAARLGAEGAPAGR